MAINRIIFCKSCKEGISGSLPVLKGTSCPYCAKELYKNWKKGGLEMKDYLFIVGDRVEGIHSDLNMVKKWQREYNKKSHNTTIAEVI